MTDKSFDFIIAGGGLAGLSLAFYLNQSSLRDKNILILDRQQKIANDHTWCFWEKVPGVFEPIVFRQWNQMWFHGTDNFSKLLNLGTYQYKMIRAADFYDFILKNLAGNHHIKFLQTGISSVSSEQTGAVVKTDSGDFEAREFLFDSYSAGNYTNPRNQNLWQHFLGLTIETKTERFNPSEATLFDFSVEQNGECRFIYILPHSANKALIEFTVFSEKILKPEDYDFFLKQYISEKLEIEEYETLETEWGVIPMSDAPIEEFPAPHIIRIGTSGGYVKPSTGYAFQRTQKRLVELVDCLTAADGKFERFNQKRFWQRSRRMPAWKLYLDSVLLNVLKKKKPLLADVFTDLFSKNDTSQVLKFLDEETNLLEDLKIMQSVPVIPFTKAAARIAAGKLRPK